MSIELFWLDVSAAPACVLTKRVAVWKTSEKNVAKRKRDGTDHRFGKLSENVIVFPSSVGGTSKLERENRRQKVEKSAKKTRKNFMLDDDDGDDDDDKEKTLGKPSFESGTMK